MLLYFSTFLPSDGEMKGKSIPKPPPPCIYMHVSCALTCSLCFIQKCKHPKMLSLCLKALIQMHLCPPTCGFSLALLHRGWERSASRPWTSLSRKHNVLRHQGFRLAFLPLSLYGRRATRVFWANATPEQQTSHRGCLAILLCSTMGVFGCCLLVLSGAVPFGNWFWCCLLGGFSPSPSI